MKDKETEGHGGQAKKRRPLRAAAIFLLIALLVFAVVAFAAYRGGTGFDVLSRYFSYGKAEEAGGAVVYDYDADSSNRFAVLGEYLLVLSETNLALLNDQGGEVLSRSVKMSAPAIHVAAAGPLPMTWAARSFMWPTARARCRPCLRRSCPVR